MTGFFSELKRQFRHGDLDRRLIIFLSFIFACLTFPELSPIYSNGIDPPLSWVFNFLIHHNPEMGKNIIFPHGPLAFVMYPLPIGYNLIITIIIYFLAKFILSYSILSSRFAHGRYRMIFSVLVTVVLLAMLDFLLILTAIVLTGYLNYLLNRQWGWLVLPVLVTSLAIFIKAFVGIVCALLGISFIGILILDYIRTKKSLRIFIFVPMIPITTLLVWFSLYGDLHGIGRYFKGMIELAGDNSAAVAYYPANNWIVLVIAGILSIILLVIHLKSRSVRFMLLVLPALFAVWKYGMAREDFLHYGMFFLFVTLVVLLFMLFIDRHYKYTVITGAAIIGLIYLNMGNALYREPMKLSVNGVRQIHQLLTDYEFFIDTCNAASEKNTLRNRLDPAIRNSIGTSYTDIYPWDYSFIAVNHLNWIPRPVLQSYACYTPWLDAQNAAHFSSRTGPEYLIWELRKITHDIHNGTMESIDGRYLFNDQPETVVSILSNYSLVKKLGGVFPVLVFKKKAEPLEIIRTLSGKQSITWNQWLDVPQQSGGLMRLKAHIGRNLAGDVKSFLYKDEACYLYYLLENEETRVYRIVPENAVQGLWIQPLVMNAENSLCEPSVKKVMFRCSDPSLMSSEIPIEWETIDFVDEQAVKNHSVSECGSIQGLFWKSKTDNRAVFIFSENNLESLKAHWSQNKNPETSVSARSGATSCKLPAESYSLSYEISLDTLLTVKEDTAWVIRAEMWAKARSKVDGSFVISIEAEHQPVSWKGIGVNDFLIQKGEWNLVTNFLRINREMVKKQSLKLKIYAWNQGRIPFWVDDFRVSVRPD